MATDRPERRVDRQLALGLVGVALVTATIAIGWFTQRRGLNLHIDEAGYVSFAVDHRNALGADGIGAWLRSARAQSGAAPLVPMLASIAILLVGHPVGTTTLVTVAFVPVLAAGTYSLARPRLAPGPAALAAALSVCAVEVVSLAGAVYFAVPAAALTTLAAAGFVRSDLGRLPRWALLGGVLLGLAFLTRSMCIAFGPAVVLLALPTPKALRAKAGRRGAAVVVVAAVLALLIGGWWLSAHTSEQLDHLGGDAITGPADVGGARGSVAKGLRLPLVVDTRQALSAIGLPIAAIGLVAVATSLRRRRPAAAPEAGIDADAEAAAGPLTTPRLLVYLAALGLPLVLAPNALGQWLVVLPPLAIVVVEAVARHRPPARTALAGALVLAATWSVVASSGIAPALDRPRSLQVPVLGSVQISDGQPLLAQHTRGGGACSRSVTSPDWFAISMDVANRARILAGDAGVTPVLFTEQLASQYVNVNTLRLADRLLAGHPEVLTGVLRTSDRLTTAEMEARFDDPAFGLPNLFLDSGAPLHSPTDLHDRAIAAAEATGFVPVVRYATPCGSPTTLWSRIVPPGPAPAPP